MPATQKKYKNDYDMKAHWEPHIHVGDEVYIYRSQHASLAPNSAEEFAQEEYKMLMWRRHVVYKVTEDKSHAVIINKDGIPNKVAIDRVIPVHKSRKEANEVPNMGNELLI